MAFCRRGPGALLPHGHVLVLGLENRQELVPDLVQVRVPLEEREVVGDRGLGQEKDLVPPSAGFNSGTLPLVQLKRVGLACQEHFKHPELPRDHPDVIYCPDNN